MTLGLSLALRALERRLRRTRPDDALPTDRRGLSLERVIVAALLLFVAVVASGWSPVRSAR